jgi:hypothetical protein
MAAVCNNLIKTNMRIIRPIILAILLGTIQHASAQLENSLYEGRFKKFNGFMSSNYYKPDILEDSLFNKAIKTAFPSDLAKFPETYKGKLIHLIGIVDSVNVEQQDKKVIFTFVIENKYWDYIEDYSIQDEVMFVSPKGDGKFRVIVSAANLDAKDIENVKQFPAEKKLFLVNGIFKEIIEGIPALTTQQIKYIDYQYYTTKVFSYVVARNTKGEVITSPDGKLQFDNFERLKLASPGQNK